MSDAWEEIQAVKSKRNSLREKLEKRKKERQNILGATLGVTEKSEGSPGGVKQERSESSPAPQKHESQTSSLESAKTVPSTSLEVQLLQVLSDMQLQLPAAAGALLPGLGEVGTRIVASLLQKFATQKLITIRERTETGSDSGLEVVSAESVRLAAVLAALIEEQSSTSIKRKGTIGFDKATTIRLIQEYENHRLLWDLKDKYHFNKRRKEDAWLEIAISLEINVEDAKRKISSLLGSFRREKSKGTRFVETSNGDIISEDSTGLKQSKPNSDDKKGGKNDTDIMSLLTMPSSREKAVKRVGEEIMDLLSKPTAKERSLADKFKSQGGAQVMEFCPHGTRGECARASPSPSRRLAGGRGTAGGQACKKLHFKKIIQGHTDESLGDCSFLNTCFHMDSCKYVHYEVDSTDPNANTKPSIEMPQKGSQNGNNLPTSPGGVLTLTPPQWIQCDLRYLDMTFLGKFAVIMADPPWDIHMELPYGTMSDDEMRCLGVPQLQDSGLIFLWVTGRAMELGRECLKLWGYERVDELIWVKTNQLQRIIRTGRTGHWLNHGKEHCLVGMKGNPENLNRGLDCDVIVAEVRATSHKPDEIYGIIERLSPGTRKIELFGRPHNIQPNWITLGNQVDGVRLVDPELMTAYRNRYPDGNCVAPPTVAAPALG